MNTSAARTATVIVTTFVLAGCGQLAGTLQVDGGNPFASAKATVHRAVSITVKPEFKSPGYKTQEVVNVYRASDVTLLEIRLFKVEADASETQVAAADLAQGDLTSSVEFTGLAPNSRYHVTAKAWAGGSLISATFSTFVDVGDNSVLAPITLTVQLIDKPFSGSASTNLDIQDGGLVPAASESITVVPTPAPTPTPAPPQMATYTTGGTLSTVATLVSVSGAATGTSYLLSLDKRFDFTFGMDRYYLKWGVDGSQAEIDLGTSWPPPQITISAPGAGSLTVNFMGTAPTGGFPLNETVTVM